jgi:hypothetical protein
MGLIYEQGRKIHLKNIFDKNWNEAMIFCKLFSGNGVHVNKFSSYCESIE